ncbi:helix-turn-helix domain-containing protein [Thermosulfurimonas dismutans]|uniref:Mobile element protein n=1 Tax=Thermosulfurimonas dismutans TaxID=999894 RepID=A0A179D4B5_9BACT|nr:helix-turn-helix domain-containing protein [Thermosulfurimonas dismutans]OAQ20920.1 Mobile element protein [Thermosulfurimonas dismutans]
MTTQEKLIKNKLGLLELAAYLKNVSEACRVMGFSRDTFYRIKKAYEEGGIEALYEKSRRKPNFKNRVSEEVERAVVELALEDPSLGQKRVSDELRKRGIFVSPAGVRSIWLRHGLERFEKRLRALDERVARTREVAFAKLYTSKHPSNSADLLNDRVIPFFEEHGLSVLRILTDRGTEFCGRIDRHEYELFLALNDIEHTKTKAKNPQTNGICERFHLTIKEEFYSIALRRKLYRSLEEPQEDLDLWIEKYNSQRPHQGKYCEGKTPMETFLGNVPLAKEKMHSNVEVDFGL